MLRLALILVCLFPFGAFAQEQPGETVYVQIEAQPDLSQGIASAENFAKSLDQVVGYRLRSGWYGILLGPFEKDAALEQLQRLRDEGAIPADSYLTNDLRFREQFFPTGPENSALADPVTAPGPSVASLPAEETEAQAKKSESQLSREDRIKLQEALTWHGTYSGKVDGAFGKATRAAMAAWQEAMGFEPTGVLTTSQRQILVENHRSDLQQFGFEPVTEIEAGIQITLPMKLVQFSAYDPPFVTFLPKSPGGLRLLLISEPGDATALSELFDILQSLKDVPASGDRQLRDDLFELSGRDDTKRAYAFAEARNGSIKGYVAFWPAGLDADMDRILPVLKTTFRSSGDMVLDPGLVPLEASVKSGILAGFEVEKPDFTQSGFYISAEGAVLTYLSPLADCGRITLDLDVKARIAAQDTATALAVLAPLQPLAPTHFARFQTRPNPVGTEIMVAGYSYGDRLPAAALGYGKLAATTGLNQESGALTLDVTILPGDVGGPVLDLTGSVIGLMRPGITADGKVLPKGTGLALATDAIIPWVAQTPAKPVLASSDLALPPDAIAAMASGMTVLVSCWAAD